VRERTLIAATLAIGIWSAACSKPDSKLSQQTPPKAGVIQASLPSTPASVPVVSGLEAGHDPQLALARPGNAKRAEARTTRVATGGAASMAEHNHAALAAAEGLPAMHLTASAETVLTLQAAPGAIPLASPPRSEGASSGRGFEPQLAGGSRGPTIIIRGGMGGPDDDCDLMHRRRGFGAAVNRMAPPIGGRSGGYGGSPRFH
jgi:hypothetical protein